MFSTILEWLKSLIKKLDYKDYIIILLTIFTIIYYFLYKHYYHESLTPIVVVDNDSVNFYKNKIKEEYAAKTIYVQTILLLKENNNELSLELKKLKDNPVVITKTLVEVKADSIPTVSDTIYVSELDSTYSLTWHNYGDMFKIHGTTEVKSDFSYFNTTIDNLLLEAELTLDIIDDGKNLRLIGRSTNPYINITNMKGTIIDPQESKILKKYYKLKKWSIGPTIGYGVTSDLNVRPYIGIGISYGLIQF